MTRAGDVGDALPAVPDHRVPEHLVLCGGRSGIRLRQVDRRGICHLREADDRRVFSITWTPGSG